MEDFIRGRRLTDTEFSRMMGNDLGLDYDEMASVIEPFAVAPLTNPIPAEDILKYLSSAKGASDNENNNYF